MKRAFDGSDLTRREFNAAAVTALFVGMVVSITDCGGSSSPTAPSSDTPASSGAPGSSASDKTGSISANHGHVAVVTAAQLSSGGGVTLSIAGTAGHDHAVLLTADEVRSIAASGRVAKISSATSTSSDDGYGGQTSTSHSHTVTFN
jgi:hypothetical protein